MKVIRKTILAKIDAEIDKDKESITRIELTSDEFRELIEVLSGRSILEYGYYITKKGDLLDFGIKSKYVDKITLFFVTPVRDDLSGSYIVYKGICIQRNNLLNQI